MTHFYPIYIFIISIAGTAIFTHVYIFITDFLERLAEKYRPNSPIKSDTDKFIEERKTRYDNTFEDQTKTYNENINSEIYDREAYNRIIKDENNELEPAWKKRILMESTPRGNLIMIYNLYKQSFDYYADCYIPYNILNAAAMKYVTVYRCRDFYIDEDHGPSKLTEAINNYEEEKKKDANKNKPASQKIDISSGPFLKSKQQQQQKKDADNKPKNEKDKDNDKNKDNKPKDKLINKFSYMGKMANFSVMDKPKKIHSSNGFKSGLLMGFGNTSYAEYKKKLADQKA